MARGAKVVVPTKEELVALVAEVNAVLGLPEPIVIGKKMSDEEIIEAVKAAADGQIYESDFEVREGEGEAEGETFFSEAAEATLKALGINALPGEPPAQEEEAPAAPAKGKDKEKAPAKDKAPAAAKAPKAAAAPRYTRANAFADACFATGADKKAIAVEVVTASANDHYAKNGGKENLKEAKWFSGLIVPALVALEYATVTDGKIQIK